MSSSMGSKKQEVAIISAIPQPMCWHCYRAALVRLPVMEVTHSRRRVLISVRSQAPANAGAGRGMNLVRDTGRSGFEGDAEGTFSVWEEKTDVNWRDKLS